MTWVFFMKLTYYLFQDSVTAFDELLDPVKRARGEAYDDVTKALEDAEFEYKIHVERNKTKAPSWASFLRPYVQEGSLDEVRNATNSFVILIKVPFNNRSRFFAITGGHGSHAINKDLVQSNFGLITTLNSIDPEEIKYFDINSIDTRAKQKRITSKIASSVFDFDLDFEHDVVRSVSGSSRDGVAGTNISGSDSLSASAKLTFRQLGERCAYFLEKYSARDYKTHFGFINNIVPERNKRSVSLLNELLAKALSDRVRDEELSVAYPYRFDDDRYVRFKIAGLGHMVDHSIIDLETVYAFLDGASQLNEEGLRQGVRVTGSEEGSDPSMVRTVAQPLFNFMVYETDYRSDHYVLSQRQWYRVAPEYMARIDDTLSDFVKEEQGLLRPWSPPVPRVEYLAGNYTNSDEYVVLSANTQAGVPSRLKQGYGDLFHIPTKRLFFVKPLYRSANHSVLFSRGIAAKKKKKTSSEYRNWLAGEVHRKTGEALSDNDFKETRVVYGLSTSHSDDLLKNLPLMAKANRLKHAKHVSKLGFEVEVVKIGEK